MGIIRTQMFRALVFASLVGAGLTLATPVSADVFVVDSVDDNGDKIPGDGECLGGAGVCTLRAAIEEANRQIYHQGISNASEYGMGTTITAAVVQGNQLVTGNVGDSRVYLVRGSQASQLTTDHTWVEERRQAGILTAEEAANHPQRNVITRSLGGELAVSRVEVSKLGCELPSDFFYYSYFELCS